MTTNTNTTNTNARIQALNFAAFVPAKELRAAFNATAQHNVLQGRVCPKCAQFLGAALGIELPTKTVDFIRAINMALAQQAPKLEPQKKRCEALRFAQEWAVLLRECSKVKTLAVVSACPEWASETAVESRAAAKAAKAAATKAAKAEAVTASAVAEAAKAAATKAAKAEAVTASAVAEVLAGEAAAEVADNKLAQAVALIVSRADELSADQRAMLAMALATMETAPM